MSWVTACEKVSSRQSAGTGGRLNKVTVLPRKGCGPPDIQEIDHLVSISPMKRTVLKRARLGDDERHAILRRTFKMILPPPESGEYVKSWGSPSSPARLKRMADSIASFARSAKHRSASNFALAISNGKSILKMLREEFYVAKFGFGWPQI